MEHDKEKSTYILKTDTKGKPILKNLKDIGSLVEDLPFNQMPNVVKMFKLNPAYIGAMVAGTSIIGDKTIQNLLTEFLANDNNKEYLSGEEYTIEEVSKRLLNYIKPYYEEAYKPPFRPYIEILISGYSCKFWEPEVVRLRFGKKIKQITEVKKGDYKIVFGGQYDVIQRIVNGIDWDNFEKLFKRSNQLLLKYHSLLQKHLEENSVDLKLPKPKEFNEELDFFGKGWPGFVAISSDITNFSDQAAIDFVDFLVQVMIKAQEFSNLLPTVGGDNHIAIINKSHGFKWISKEEYKYKDYGVSKND